MNVENFLAQLESLSPQERNRQMHESALAIVRGLSPEDRARIEAALAASSATTVENWRRLVREAGAPPDQPSRKPRKPKRSPKP